MVRFVPRAISLSVQLVVVLTGLVLAATITLGMFAYSASRQTLEAGAIRAVREAADTREQTITRTLTARRRSTETLLSSARALCGETLDEGRMAWALDCLRPIVNEFYGSERAEGVELSYRGRVLERLGMPVQKAPPPTGSIVRIGPEGRRQEYYQVSTTDRDLTLTVAFGLDEIRSLFTGPAGLGPGGAVFLIDPAGEVLAASRDGDGRQSIDQAAGRCRDAGYAEAVPGQDERTIHAVTRVPVLGDACVAAEVPVAAAFAPAEELRNALTQRSILLVMIGALVSLLAAHWIAAPVRRLAVAAARLQQGHFESPMPISGPSEVRQLGHALQRMSAELAQLIEREQEARRQAQSANEAKDQFLAMVSHELRTPLSAIVGWAGLLRRSRLDADTTKLAVVAIERNAELQRRLVDDLLDVSRIVSGQLRVASEVVSLAGVVEAAVDSVRPQAVEKRVQLHVELEASCDVLGDAERLQQIVWNLLSNALKFTPPEGCVTVRLQCTDRAARLEVSDTGSGIPRTFLPHVFDWFRQGSSARTRRFSGLGLGLGIVRQLVHAHGGEVQVESEEGHGSRFLVTLPILPDQGMRDVPNPVPSPAATRLDPLSVLLVEDDDEMREMVKAVLEDAGASVRVAADALEARLAVATSVPDMIISDIAMPQEDGYSLVRSLRASHVNVPAIALTAYARHDDAEAARAAGFDLHISKPVNPARLVETIATLARSRPARPLA